MVVVVGEMKVVLVVEVNRLNTLNHGHGEGPQFGQRRKYACQHVSIEQRDVVSIDHADTALR